MNNSNKNRYTNSTNWDNINHNNINNFQNYNTNYQKNKKIILNHNKYKNNYNTQSNQQATDVKNRNTFNKKFSSDSTLSTSRNSNSNENDQFNSMNTHNDNIHSFSPIVSGPKYRPRYFVIKSMDEDNIHKSIKYKIWCSTPKGNFKLNKAFKDSNGNPIYLFFSVNGSGRFLGVAQMTSEIDLNANFNFWSQCKKWKGFFCLVWLIIKDVANRAFNNIINE